MNVRQLHRNPPLRDKLAAEFVLGTLRAGARRRFEGWVREDAALRAVVAEWQQRLLPLAEFSPAVAPPPRAWSALQDRLGLASERRSFWRGLRDDLAFWRGLGLVSSTLAVLLVVTLLTREPAVAPAQPSYIATLADEQARVALLITGDAEGGRITARVVSQVAVDAQHSLELWAVPAQGAPRSLGLLGADGTATLPLPPDVTPQQMPVLAVSLEPKGGSPNRSAPSGPILYKGAWLKVQG